RPRGAIARNKVVHGPAKKIEGFGTREAFATAARLGLGRGRTRFGRSRGFGYLYGFRGRRNGPLARRALFPVAPTSPASATAAPSTLFRRRRFGGVVGDTRV